MVKANKRLPASVSVSKSALESVTSALEGLPEKPKENWSLREAVSVLQESISAALGKGYSYEEVSNMLSEKGVEISASSLKSYLSAAKRQKLSTAKGKRTGRRTKKMQTGDVSMNGATTASALINSKAALSELNGNSDATVELPTQNSTRRKSQTSTTRKTAAKAKTSTRAVSQTKATSKSTGRKKSS